MAGADIPVIIGAVQTSDNQEFLTGVEGEMQPAASAARINCTIPRH